MDFALSFDVIEKKQKREKSGELLLTHKKERPLQRGKTVKSSRFFFGVT